MPIGRLQLSVLLLGIVFLAAQFHFCADLKSNPMGSHDCPFCAAADSAIVTQMPSVILVPILNSLESWAVFLNLFPEPPRATSPRAPPCR
jgi:hypothetical protein